jgi:hypothetical protein
MLSRLCRAHLTRCTYLLASIDSHTQEKQKRTYTGVILDIAKHYGDFSAVLGELRTASAGGGLGKFEFRHEN